MKPTHSKRPAPAVVVLTVSLTLGLIAAVMIGMVPGFLHRLFLLICVVTAFCALLFLPNQSPSMRRVTRLLKRGTAVCLALVALSFVAVEMLILSHTGGDETPQGEVLIVLGAGLNGETPSLSLQSRLQKALEYLEQHPDMLAVLSGGQGPDEDIPEAVAMQRYLVARGVDPGRLLMEQESHNTYQNLLYSRALLERELGHAPDEVVVLSNGFHLFRAEFLAARVGFQADTIDAPLPNIQFLPLNNYLREYFAVVKSFFLDRP